MRWNFFSSHIITVTDFSGGGRQQAPPPRREDWTNGVWNREHWCVVKASAASEARTQQTDAGGVPEIDPGFLAVVTCNNHRQHKNVVIMRARLTGSCLCLSVCHLFCAAFVPESDLEEKDTAALLLLLLLSTTGYIRVPSYRICLQGPIRFFLGCCSPQSQRKDTFPVPKSNYSYKSYATNSLLPFQRAPNFTRKGRRHVMTLHS
jgi:hypothetical protein